MSAPTITVDVLQNPDLAAAYQQAYDALSDAYWHASDVASKDLIHGTQMSLGKIITALDEEDLAKNTADFTALLPQMKSINDSLAEIKESIGTITRDFQTASMVLAAVNKVLSLLPL